ncbi:hypothetical protein AVEN_198452-1 [Araneus ventricosus]|uniref:Uncharacterized protein n=1 Tax=Araneus ventricosus TaxID=182803 RepID=A0A4Y2LG99_ARAVE|nr:hypothetical protein AVEN_51618-1 [Araneus ventricosus]GBN13181.1 hypothetical protein AVEN_61215-1 [Araneus ventricosus]GBN13190.1 hypothetical protein AVEN_68620-1 [Araneus ventricosus]GBN13241.1 hypothetical protein AVEN_198452-1 [Araneus ventricosus]
MQLCVSFGVLVVECRLDSTICHSQSRDSTTISVSPSHSAHVDYPISNDLELGKSHFFSDAVVCKLRGIGGRMQARIYDPSFSKRDSTTISLCTGHSAHVDYPISRI